MAVVSLLKVFLVLLCIPWKVGLNKSIQKMKEPVNVMPQDTMEVGMDCSEVVTAAFVALCAIFVIYQLYIIWNHEKETLMLNESLFNINSKINGVTRFYGKTEALFEKLEKKSKVVKLRFENSKKRVDQMPTNQNIERDFGYLKGLWEYEFQAFSRFGIEHFRPITQTEIQAQLTMAKAFTGSELRRVQKQAAEDRLSLNEVEADVRRLQKYFGNT